MNLADLPMGPMPKHTPLHLTVTAVHPPEQTPEGYTIQEVTVTDHTGTAILVLWHATPQTLYGRSLTPQVGTVHPGDLLELVNGYTKLYRNTKTLSTGYSGKLYHR